MAGTIDLPTLVQKIRVDTSGMARAEKAVKGFGDTADGAFSDATDASDDYTKSTRKATDATDDLRATIVETRQETGKYADDAARMRQAIRNNTSETTEFDRRISESRRNVKEHGNGVSRVAGLLDKFGDSMRGAGNGAGVMSSALGLFKVPAIVGGLTLIAGGISAIGAAAVGLVGQLAPAVGALASLPAALGALLSAKAVFSALVKGPAEAAKAIQKYGAASEQAKEALKALPPEARKFTLQLVKTQNEFKRIVKVGQKAALPNFSKALEKFRTLLPLVEKGFKGIATVIGNTALELSKAVTAGPFKADLGVIIGRNTTLVKTLASALVPLVTTLKNVVLAAGPMTQLFAESFVTFSKFLAATTGGEAGQKRLTDFFTKTTDVIYTLGRTLRDFGVGLKNVFGIGAENSTDFLGNLEALARKFRDFTESFSGKSKIAKFFQDAKPAIHETGLLIRDVVSFLGGLSGNADLAPVISQIRTELLPAFERLVDAVGENVGPTLVNLATAFVNFQNVLSFSPIIAVANALAELVTGVTGIIQAVPGLPTVVASFLALRLVLKGAKFASAASGLTGLASGLRNIGPAGTAGQKGIAGFIQGLKGANKAGGKLTAANFFGKALKGAKDKGKEVGKSFASGLSGALSGAKGAGKTFITRLGEDLKDIGSLGKRAGGRLVTGIKAGAKGAAGAGKSIAAGVGRGLSSLASVAGAGLAKIGPVLKIVAAGFKVAAGAAKAFTIALLTNPVFLIIAAVIALVAALVYAYKHSETFRRIVDAAFTAVKNVAISVFNFLKTFITTVIKAIGTVIRVYVNIYKTIFTTAFKVIKTIVTTVFNFIKTYITTVLAIYRKIFSVAWNAIKKVVSVAIGIIKTVISTAMGIIKGVFRTGFNIVKGIVRTVFVEIPRIIKEKVDGILKFLGGFGAKILDRLGDFGSLLYNAGKALIEGLLNGIKSLFSAPVDLVKDMAGNVISAIGGVFNLGSPSKVTEQQGGYVAEGLALGIDRGRRHITESVRLLGQSTNSALTTAGLSASKQAWLQGKAVGSNLSGGVSTSRVDNEVRLLGLRTKDALTGLGLSGSKQAQLQGRLIGEGLAEGVTSKKERVKDSVRVVGAQSSKVALLQGQLVAEAVAQGIDQKKKNVVAALQRLGAKSGLGPVFRGAGKHSGYELSYGLSEGLTVTLDYIKAWGVEALAQFTAAEPLWKAAGDALGKALRTGIKGQTSQILTYFERFGLRILDRLGSFNTLLYDTGVSLVQGLINGINSLADGPVNAIRNIGNNVITGIHDTFALGSPSKITMKQGAFVSEGLAIGIDRNRSLVEKSLKGLAAQTQLAATVGNTPLAKATVGGSSGNVTSITYDQRKTYDVNVNETTGPTTVDSLTRRLATISLLGPQAAAAGGGLIRV